MHPVEPWLRGPMEGVSPLVAPVLFALQQTKEDLEIWTAGLPEHRLWAASSGLAPLGFQLKHIAGSIDRLLTYAKGEVLSATQMGALRGEALPTGSIRELLAEVNSSIDRVNEFVRSIDPAALTEARGVGRKQLPTSVIGLLVHIAEHTQRHVGEMIVTVRILRSSV